ncbi:MAG: hypothetical protein KIT31_22235 [Deltaproteobacteria bacterium]|nr:hypothetical protein [Deltaproteobacteria bacterium]
MRRLHAVFFGISVCATACTVGDESEEATSGASVTTIEAGLSGCKGKASSEVPANGRYTITTFGGPGDHQPMSCGGYANGTGWYAASRQRYGCGAKLKIEANGKCAVVTADDYGPDVCVEKAAGMPIIDVSPKVTKHLFGMSGAGWSDRVVVTVEEVAASTPVGPCVAGQPPAPTMTTCNSSTLERDVEEGVCVQAASDAKWYQCRGGEWVAKSSATGCATAFGFCNSATLGKDVPARTCVQAASNNVWYQCNGQSWVTPVDTAARSGALGACSSWNPL